MNLLNYAYDYFPPADHSLCVNIDWRLRVIDAGEAKEVDLYEEAGRSLCDYVRRHGVHELTPFQSFELMHVLSRMKVFIRSVRLRNPEPQLVAELNKFALMIGWRVWREAVFGEAVTEICRKISRDRRNL